MGEGLKQLDQLRHFIDGRPICLLGGGPSLAELPPRLRDVPRHVVWAAHNVYAPFDRMLEPVGDAIDLLFVSAPQMIQEYHPQVRAYLERRHGLFMTTTMAMPVIEQYQPGALVEFDHKIVVGRCELDAPEHPDAFEVVQYKGQFFSFMFQLLMLLKAGARLVVLFGFDGGKIDGYPDWYFGRPEDYPSNWWAGMSGYGNEVLFINGSWPNICAAAGIDLEGVRILNCSPKSHITAFEKIDYPDLKSVFA